MLNRVLFSVYIGLCSATLHLIYSQNLNLSSCFCYVLELCAIVQSCGGEIVFYDIYISLCQRENKKPSVVASELGINKSNVSNWKNNGYTPRGDVLQKIADYFDVTTDYLLGVERKEKAPAPEGELGAKLAELVPGMTDIQKKAVQIVLRADEDWLKAFIRLAEKE